MSSADSRELRDGQLGSGEERETLARHAAAIAKGEVLSVTETRAVATTSTIGAATMYDDPGLRAPQTLRSFARIPVGTVKGNKLQIPTVSVSGAAGVNESTAHGEQTAGTDDLSMARYGRWSAVSALVDALSEVTTLSAAHQVGIALDLNLLDAAAIEDAAGTPLTFAADIAANVRRAILQVSQNTGFAAGDLVLIGSAADLSLVADITASGGDALGEAVVRFAGARLFPTAGTTAGILTVFAGANFQAVTDPVSTAATVDPKDGARTFGSWLHATPSGMVLSGSAVAVDVVTG